MAAVPTVLVVGAGPVGLLAAAELARRHVPVRIIDKLPAPTQESRAIAIHARSLDMLARIGVVDQLLDTGVAAHAMELRSGGKCLLRVPLGSVDAAYRFSLNTPQTETERVLTEHLASLGVTVERPVELTGLAQDADSVRVSLHHQGGAEEHLNVAWVIGADGARSTVRHLVGGRLEGTFAGERFVLGDVDATHDLDSESMYTFFSPAGSVLAIPLRHGRMRVMAHLRHGEDTAPEGYPTLAGLQEIVDNRVGGITLLRSHWLTVFELRHAQVRQYRWGRVFLMGDAAHIHSPAGGQGMNTGMQDAFNLAWKLAAVVHDEAGSALLDSYHTERHPVAAEVITMTERLSRGGTLSGPGQHVRNTVLRAVSHVKPLPRAVAGWLAEVTVNYRDSPIVLRTHGLRGASVAAGDHFPDLGDNTVAHQLLKGWGPGHTTLTVAGNHRLPVPVHGHGRQVLLTANGTRVAGYDLVIADQQQLAARRLGLPEGGVVVVRPDGYIGAVAALEDRLAVTAYFAGLSA
ncbi:hypothetical protein BVC93_04540 [Mycobacterium sp. MS1601]|uniref:FAD-dependent monooxygenase n=1 Tax=Mycobacterium sp. MS1601 TaxID=1936029 RepID=UPI0009795E16|nr:FAD-dependent monooxygenase [Mycobacterium sp. MS1601]AQA01828.1 hypothetical protein BVC93_04540 [Mycobacterium sp. MS1601]